MKGKVKYNLLRIKNQQCLSTSINLEVGNLGWKCM